MAPAWRTWTALGIVYVVWGSTYLAIAYLVKGFPPLLSAGVRFLVSGLIIAAFVAVRRGRAPFRATGRQWSAAAAIGVLLLLGGNGGVMLAEDADLPSGLTALLVACVPLFVVVLRWASKDIPSSRTLAGVVIGFLGLTLLLLPGARPEGVPLGAAALVVGAGALWSVGSFFAGKWSLPSDPLLITAAEMIGGALGLLLVGLLRGETITFTGVPASAWWAFGYLVVFGSVIAFTAYSWLLQNVPLSKAATYAYVNPVVAVVLGALIAGEDVTATALTGGLITVAAVFLVVTETSGSKRSYVPSERHGRLRSSET